MIHLITGVPGSGKSLLAIELILKNFQSPDIKPCYSNINGLEYDALRCFTLDDVEHWFDLPDGAIIVIDECQRWFRPRPNGSTVPEFISRFETHRHQGLDIILITQHPGLIDRNIRKLVELHQHMYRPFGMERRTVFEWNTCNESPEPNQSADSANKHQKPFDKSLFQYYKSATIHTHKKRLPYKKFAVLVTCVLIVIGAFFKIAYEKSSAASQAKNVEAPISSPQNKEDVEKIKQEKPIAKSQELGAVELYYKGYMRENTKLKLFLEDAQGYTYDLSDFSGYQKNGVLIVFNAIGDSITQKYYVKDHELLALLP